MSDTPRPLTPVRPPGGPRRRYLTMLFSDLSDSTRIAAAMEAEHYAEVLGDLRRAYQEIIPKHGGTIVQIQGDGILAIFGYPDANEDSGRRATEAALDLHDTVRNLPLGAHTFGLPPMSLHTGIHSGLVLFDEGDLVRGRFELLGNATNIASRLGDVAEPDEILISESSLGPESNFFQTSERRYLHLKGKDKPLTVYRIIARAPVSTRFEARARRGLVPFVGRRAELGILERSLEDTIAGKPRYLALVGPAGLGKTRLAEEFLALAAQQDCQVLRGYCDSYLSAEPLQPFLQILRSLCGLSHGMSPALAAESLEKRLREIDPGLLRHRAELLGALSLAAAGNAERPGAEKIIAAFRDLFDRLAASKPVVLFIDDWQWADAATRQVLSAIGGLEARAIFMLVATRGPEAGDLAISDARNLDLAPLTEQEAAQTIERLLGLPDPVVMTKIQKSSGGNPLYIEELCHSAAYEGKDRRLSRANIGSAWLNNLIQSRVSRLPDEQVDLVRAAAVIGNVIPSWLLESLTGCGEKHPLVRGLAEQDFIFPGETPGTLRFKHGIARDVIYDAIGLRERKEMHLRIAESLREQDPSGGQEEIYEALALHYGAGGRPAEAARYAELAGDKAVAASALDRALTQYRAALAALDLLPQTEDTYQRWSAIVQRFAQVCAYDPSREQLVILARAVELASAHDDRAAVARAEFWLGYVSYAMGEPRDATLHLEKALATAGQLGDDRFVLRVRSALGQARAGAADYAEALPLLDEAIAARRVHPRGGKPPVGFSYTLCIKAAVLGDQGYFADAQACFDEALEAVRGANHEVEASVLGFRSCVYLWQGCWEDALRSATDAQRVAERVKSFFIVAADQSLAAYARWSMQRTPESLQGIVDATSWMEGRDKRLNICMNYGWLCEAMAANGRIKELRAYAFRAIDRARAHDRLGLAMTYRALARAAAQGQGRKSAQRYLALAMDAARARGSRHEVAATQMCGAEIAAARGGRAVAIALLDQAEPAFAEMRMDWHLESARRLRASLEASTAEGQAAAASFPRGSR